MTEIQKLIKNERKARGMTVEEFGELIGVTGRCVWEYESGRRNPPAKMIDRIVKALGYEIVFRKEKNEEP